MMKKEEFSLKIVLLLRETVRSEYIKEFEDLIGNFLETNVIIQRGENRHPNTDVLHQWLEGIECEAFFKNESKWKDVSSFNALIVHEGVEYRIKPKEPIYEWQWLHYSKTLNEVRGVTLDFFTEDEVDDDVYRWVKIEETKRERKQ